MSGDAMSTEWIDTTTYSRSATERIPTSFQIVSGLLDITITTRHESHPGVWVMSSRSLNIEAWPLNIEAWPLNIAVGLAKDAAIRVAVKRITTLLNDAINMIVMAG